MIADATIALQEAITIRLKTDPGVAAIVGDRVYDAVAPNAVKPYLSFGPIESRTQSADLYEGSEVVMQIDGWSGGGSGDALGSLVSKQLGAAVRAALHDEELSLADGQRLVLLQIDSLRYLRDADGITEHAVITLTALTEPA